ncbi:MAG TPA: phosphoglycerate dehydrogenase [Rhodospirillales bacterium]|nr:phosphoglycerate dehydrogenase [Rhodospirillales bacterium]
MSRLSVPKDKIRIVLVEGVHDSAARLLAANGYVNVERLAASPAPEMLGALLAEAHILGIRSRTRLTAELIAKAPRLFCIGCFCIGTNQVDLDAAKSAGIPVFNAPYSNTRSVAELVLGEIIMLMRRIPEKSALAHRGLWRKSDAGAREVRGKTLGIVGYGHIGSQLSILAEAIGMRVRYYDIVEKLSLGNARPAASLDELLGLADVVSLHVPATAETRGMIGTSELARMRPGALLINAARGEVVDVDALATALSAGRIGGAAVDVFPVEPMGGSEPFQSPLRGLGNVILTPHVGGATEEAQASIGAEVADKLARYSDSGATIGAVNCVEVSLPTQRDATRFLHIHRNVPGVLSRINDVFSAKGLNISGQYLRTDAEIGYVVTDIDGRLDAGTGIRRELAAITGTLRVRLLY